MVTFYKEPQEMKALAAYVAELTRQGINFEMKSDRHSVEVRILGH